MIYYTLDVIIVERDGVETETDRTEFYKTGYSSVSSKSDAKKRSEIEMCIAPDIIIKFTCVMNTPTKYKPDPERGRFFYADTRLPIPRNWQVSPAGSVRSGSDSPQDCHSLPSRRFASR